MDLFFYGTLCHPAIMDIVSGETNLHQNFVSAVARDYQVVRVLGERFPCLVRRQGAQSPGKLLPDVSPSLLERFTYYEDPSDYSLGEIEVFQENRRLKGHTYFPLPSLEPTGEIWDYHYWERHHLEDYIKETKEFMENLR